MMRSLFAGVSGLRVHQTRMDVIGNNIANVNTVGFKASRMTFADAMSQMIEGASADNPQTGRVGRDPQQIGLGVNVGGIDNLMTQGAAQRTDQPLDLTIQGDGFFIVSDESGTFFTRAGNVRWNGNYFSIGGMRLMGWNAAEDVRNPGTYNIQQGMVQPLRTPPEMHFMDPSPTSLVTVMGNLNTLEATHDEEHDPPTTFTVTRPVEFFDTLGNQYTAMVTFRWHPPTSHSIFEEMGVDPATVDVYSSNTQSIWTWSFDGPEPGVATVTPRGSNESVNIEVNLGEEDGPTTGILIFSPGTTSGGGRLLHVGGFDAGAFDSANAIPTTGAQRSLSVYLSTTEGGVLLPPAFPGAPVQEADYEGNLASINFDFGALMAAQGMPTNMRMTMQNGNAPGQLVEISAGADGTITGRYSNGVTRTLGQIALAMFMNPAGLQRAGNNLWLPTANSGWFDGVGEVGDMMPGTLEMSNVDLSSEFTEMIITQRGFQANSRVITTSDEMIAELVNLRR
ncbi:MAG: flagellar hook protein FlgE [Turicibacter sp.]|nr:flagellar hook protein FlgE [Turicibacter sp.]